MLDVERTIDPLGKLETMYDSEYKSQVLFSVHPLLFQRRECGQYSTRGTCLNIIEWGRLEVTGDREPRSRWRGLNGAGARAS